MLHAWTLRCACWLRLRQPWHPLCVRCCLLLLLLLMPASAGGKAQALQVLGKGVLHQVAVTLRCFSKPGRGGRRVCVCVLVWRVGHDARVCGQQGTSYVCVCVCVCASARVQQKPGKCPDANALHAALTQTVHLS